MTNFQKAVCLFLSLCFFAVLAVLPSPFFLSENVYRQFPLYCFLEEKENRALPDEDGITSEKIMESDEKYLEEKVQEEQQLAKVETGNTEEQNEVKVQEEKGKKGTQAAEKQDGEAQAAEKQGAEAQAAEEQAENRKKEGAATEEQETDEEQEKASAKEKEQGMSETKAAVAQPHPLVDLSPESLSNFDYLLNQFFILDENTATNAQQLNAAQFLEEDLTIRQDASVPQILIYHSHSQETFADSREGEQEDTVVGVGDYLTQLLTETYGYQVIHVKETFDIIDGEIDRSRAYDFAREYVEQILEENPTIEVIIDLHRDGVPEDRHLMTEINGKDTAQVMFYNGLSYTVNHGAVEYLPNPYIEDNLAFSFQLEYQAAQYYPEFYRGIYLAGLRYNLHLRPRALLLEAGAQTNTVQEVKNAMEPFADILNRVLTGTK